MIHLSTRKRVWEKLLESLGGAEAGGRELDIVIHYLLGAEAANGGGEARQMIELLVEEGYAWEVVSELLDAELPPYTTSLDAALPGENIVLALYSPRRGRWAAVHMTPDGEQVLVWAASECLARRRAALKALGTELLSRAAATAAATAPAAAPTGPAKPAAPRRAAPVAASSVHGWSRTPQARTQGARTQGAPTREPQPQEAEAPEEGEWKILF